jgi:hypothetical protein
MKKILALTSLIFALSVGATAMASDYEETNDKINGVTHRTALANGYATVLVQASNNDIVYVDQADSVFPETLEIMLKAGIDDGEYTMKFGGAGKALETKTLELKSGTSDPDPDPADTVTMSVERTTEYTADNFKNIAYQTTVAANYNKIKFTCTIGGQQKTATLDIDGISNLTGVAADVVVLVKNVPLNITDLSVALVNVPESN